MTPRHVEIAAQIEAVRRKTLELLDQTPKAAFCRQVHPFYSPIGWHFGHIARIEEFWVLENASGIPALRDDWSFLFTDRPDNPKESRVNLPAPEDLRRYLEITRHRSMEALAKADVDAPGPLLADGFA